MRDWLIRSKKICKEHRNSIYENSNYTQGCHGAPKEEAPRAENLTLMPLAPWMTEKSLWCHVGRTCWKPAPRNSLEVHPFGSQGRLFMRKYLAGGTLLLDHPEGVLGDAGGCSRLPNTAGARRWGSTLAAGQALGKL